MHGLVQCRGNYITSCASFKNLMYIAIRMRIYVNIIHMLIYLLLYGNEIDSIAKLAREISVSVARFEVLLYCGDVATYVAIQP